MKAYIAFFLLFYSVIYLSAQNIGIGTTNPTEKLEVEGIIYTNQGGVKFPDKTVQTTAATSHIPNPNSRTREGVVMEVIQRAQGGVPYPIIGPYNSPSMGDVPEIRNALPLIEASLGSTVPIEQAGSGSEAASLQQLKIKMTSEENTPNFLGIISTIDEIERINLHWLTSDGNGGKISHMVMEIQNATMTEHIVESTWMNGGFAHTLHLSFIYEKVRYISFSGETEVQNTCWNYFNNDATCPDPL